MIKKKKFSLEDFKSELNNFKTKKAPFFEIEQYILSCINKHPAEEINIEGAVFSELKDAYTKEVLSYGEEFVKANPKNDKYKNVLADRYKKLGNIKRHNELLGIKELSSNEFKTKLADFKSKKVAFTEIQKYIAEQLKQYPSNEIEIKGAVFSELKDAYTKEVLSYGEEFVKANPKNDRYKNVLADRYKKLGNIKRHNELLGIKELLSDEFKAKLADFKSKKVAFTEIQKYIAEQLKQYPSNEIEIKGAVFSELKDAYTKEVLSYGEEFVKANPKNDRYKNVLADRYKKLGNIKRYNELLGIKEFSITDIKNELLVLKDLKPDFSDIEKYIDNILKSHPDKMVIIKVMFYAMFKDLYPNQIEKYRKLV
ncbi:hypothetical protein [Francisella salina]|uniref:Uncharacterized protein n=1 Tax=Francisella salina TaxID=573569 RepID=A0ABM5M962_FRAST|nr:hypothetical protein [Francisella salina]AEI35703.1 hypothetical protein F7308_0776 [Francisella salina]